jgi:hypothetical protein
MDKYRRIAIGLHDLTCRFPRFDWMVLSGPCGTDGHVEAQAPITGAVHVSHAGRSDQRDF